jgi:uncharacterized membrane protein
MSKLFVLKFDNEATAQQVVATLKSLQDRQLIKLEDAAIVTMTPDGKPRVQQMHNLVGAGALGGAFWGLLIGLLFFVPVLGMLVGAGAGALAAKFSDIGIDDNFIKQVGSSIHPGESALFLLVAEAVADKVLPELKQYKFQVIQTNLSKEDEAKLHEMIGQTTAST